MYAYTLIRSARKTLALEITTDARVVVRAPRLCPQREIDAFVEQHTAWLDKHIEQQKKRKPPAFARPVTPEQEQALRRQAATHIPERVAHYSRLMGVTPTGIKITGAQKRFGSCSGQNSLCFSWRLMLLPPQAIDYVVVHELAHIRHHNHSAAFYAFVAQIMPDYKQRQALLRG